MNKIYLNKIGVFFLFIGLLSQLIFVKPSNVIYANIFSLLVFIPFSLLIITKRFKVEIELPVIWYFVFCIYMSLTIFWNEKYHLIEISKIIRPFIILAYVFIICELIKSRSSLYWIRLPFILAVIFNFLLYVKVFYFSLFGELFSDDLRFEGTFENSNEIMLISFIALSFSLIDIHDKNIYVRAISIICISCSIFLLLASGSKKGLIILTLIPFIFLVIAIRKFDLILLLKFTFFIVIFIFSSYSFLMEYIDFEFLSRRVDGFFGVFTGGADGSTQARTNLIVTGLKGIADNPLLGQGMYSFEKSNPYYSHNNYIEVLFSGGLLGGIIYYFYYFYILYYSKKIKDLNFRVIYILPIISLFILDVAVVSSSLKYLIFAIVTVYLNIKYYSTPRA